MRCEWFSEFGRPCVGPPLQSPHPILEFSFSAAVRAPNITAVVGRRSNFDHSQCTETADPSLAIQQTLSDRPIPTIAKFAHPHSNRTGPNYCAKFQRKSLDPVAEW